MANTHDYVVPREKIKVLFGEVSKSTRIKIIYKLDWNKGNVTPIICISDNDHAHPGISREFGSMISAREVGGQITLSAKDIMYHLTLAEQRISVGIVIEHLFNKKLESCTFNFDYEEKGSVLCALSFEGIEEAKTVLIEKKKLEHFFTLSEQRVPA